MSNSIEGGRVPADVGKTAITCEELQEKLLSAGIDTSQWGTGKAKTLEHLLKEVSEGEAELVKTPEGALVRRTTVGKADIYFIDTDGTVYRLKEDRQVFKDGRERKRNLDSAVSEKLKVGEDHADAVTRGIQEELGIEGEKQVEDQGITTEQGESPSYPGLGTEYVLHRFKVTIGGEQYKSEGYQEDQPDKTTFFVWEKVG